MMISINDQCSVYKVHLVGFFMTCAVSKETKDNYLTLRVIYSYNVRMNKLNFEHVLHYLSILLNDYGMIFCI